MEDYKKGLVKDIKAFLKKKKKKIFDMRGFDVSLWYHSWHFCTCFCVCKCLLFQFFCLKGCLLSILQLNMKGSGYCLDCKKDLF